MIGNSTPRARSYATRHMGGAASAIGSRIQMEGKPFQVIGVVPVSFPRKAEVWYSAGQHEEIPNRTAYNYWAVARLKPGVSIEQATSEMEGIAASLAAQYPNDNRQKSAAVVLLRDDVVGGGIAHP